MSFLKKINLAKVTYDYSDESKEQKAKAERINAINDLIQLLSDQRMVTQLFIPNIENVMDMIKKNIFRPLPNANRGNALAVTETGVEEEEQEPDNRWIHIRGIYDIFLQLVINEACDVKTLKQFITSNFYFRIFAIVRF